MACFAIYREICHLYLWKRIDKQGVRNEHLNNRFFTIASNGETSIVDYRLSTLGHWFTLHIDMWRVDQGPRKLSNARRKRATRSHGWISDGRRGLVGALSAALFFLWEVTLVDRSSARCQAFPLYADKKIRAHARNHDGSSFSHYFTRAKVWWHFWTKM